MTAYNKWTVLCSNRSAFYNGDMSLVEYLVDNGANVNIIDAEGNTRLMVSVKYPNIC